MQFVKIQVVKYKSCIFCSTFDYLLTGTNRIFKAYILIYANNYSLKLSMVVPGYYNSAGSTEPPSAVPHTVSRQTDTPHIRATPHTYSSLSSDEADASVTHAPLQPTAYTTTGTVSR